MSDDTNAVLSDHTDNVLTVTLNRPARLNALDDKMAGELIGLLKQAARSGDIRAIVITGAGKGFCAGQDLAAVQDRDPDMSFRRHLQHTYNPLISRIRALEKPVITAINGAAAGAGLGLALAGDIRLASSTAKFRTAFIGIGLVPDSGVSYWLPRLIGPARAAHMAFTNELVLAAQALDWGMINAVHPPDDLLPAALDLARTLAAGPTKGLGLTKRALNRALLYDIDDTLDYEAHLQDIAGRTADYEEGVAAFLEKRTPQFSGK